MFLTFNFLGLNVCMIPVLSPLVPGRFCSNRDIVVSLDAVRSMGEKENWSDSVSDRIDGCLCSNYRLVNPDSSPSLNSQTLSSSPLFESIG